MVKRLSGKTKEAVHNAVQSAHRETSAGLAVVIAPMSDGYQYAQLCCGLALGTIAAILLWAQKIVPGFPLLLVVQFGVAFLWLVIPYTRRLSLKLVPGRVLRHRAAQRAAAEYVHATHHLAASVPFVLIYVSLAERYVHIYSSRTVREKIPDREWGAVVATLTGAVLADGLESAVTQAVGHTAAMLKPHFPPS